MEKKKFSVIYADPPWDSSLQRGGRGAISHYDLMDMKQLKSMPIAKITTDNAACFLWVGNGMYKEGVDVLKSWGFTLKSDFIWVKPRCGLGKYFRYASEKMLLGVKGKKVPVYKGQPNWGFFPVQDHSHKPEEIHPMIERMYPGERYLELFARRRPSNPEWYCWGNECPGGSDIVISGYPVPEYSDRAKVTTMPQAWKEE